MTPRKFFGYALVLIAALAVLAALLSGYFQLIKHTGLAPATVLGAEHTAAAPVALSAGPVAPGAHHRTAPQDRVPAGTPGLGMGRVLLGQLVVAPHEQGPAYRRDEFGSPWFDTDRNRCNTRDDVLAAWMIDTKTDGCEVTEGQLVDPYTGAHITNPIQVDIDHVVSLGDAWRSGAARWTKERRTEFANDVRHLVPVSASANRSKGDKPAEKWLPPDAVYHCDYALIIIATKHAYRLTVTAEERNALDRALMTC